MSDEQSTVEYRIIKDFPDYRVGDDGSVWSKYNKKDWKLLKPSKQKKGYLMVKLYPGPVYRKIHRLVLEAFVGPCPPEMEACHFPDRDSANNYLKNLRWGTKLANSVDKRLHGTMINGEKVNTAILTEDQVKSIRAEYIGRVFGYKKLAQKYGIAEVTAYKVVHRITWRHVL